MFNTNIQIAQIWIYIFVTVPRNISLHLKLEIASLIPHVPALNEAK